MQGTSSFLKNAVTERVWKQGELYVKVISPDLFSRYFMTLLAPAEIFRTQTLNVVVSQKLVISYFSESDSSDIWQDCCKSRLQLLPEKWEMFLAPFVMRYTVSIVKQKCTVDAASEVKGHILRWVVSNNLPATLRGKFMYLWSLYQRGVVVGFRLEEVHDSERCLANP